MIIPGGIGFVLGLVAGIKIRQATDPDRTHDEVEPLDLDALDRKMGRRVPGRRWTDEGLRDRTG